MINSAFNIRYIGSSKDGRANRWAFICKCNKKFSPPTTLLRQQLVVCPKCNTQEVIDYNEVQT